MGPVIDTYRQEKVDDVHRYAESVGKPELYIFGDHEVRLIPIDWLIGLTQVREDENPQSEELGGSIKQLGLRNWIDVGVMTADGLSDYIKFDNNLWNANHKLEDYTPQKDGYYYLVIAGHSRLKQMKIQAAQTPNKLAVTWCKIEHDPSRDRILALQLAENIHSAPPVERLYRALAMAFKTAKEAGTCSSKADFIRQHGNKFSVKTLNNALYFDDLSDEMREILLKKGKHIATGVLIGKSLDVVKQYYGTLAPDLYCYNYDDEQRIAIKKQIDDQIEANTQLWVQRTVLHIQNEGWNGPAARKHVEGIVKHFQEIIEANNKNQTLDATLFMVSPDEWLINKRLEQETQYRTLIRELGCGKIEDYYDLVKLHAALVDGGEAILMDIELEFETTVRNLGRGALDNSNNIESFGQLSMVA